MNGLKLTIQICCLALLATIALILSHNQSAAGILPASPSPSTSSDASAWKYDDFKFEGSSTKEFSKILYANLVFYDYKEGAGLDTAPTRTNRVNAVSEIWERIGQDGWQFVWTDGTNCLTRRMEGLGKHAYFIIAYLPKSE